ncbi:MAG: hypothetical protein LBU00_03685 [Treponema sp.]|jgi:hypothetical protein|nr:hypothetical protein [Treponema sp.]
MENQQFTKATIGAPEPWLIEAAAGISLNLARFVHEITNQFEDHALNRHGDPAFHGAATITAADFSRIPGIIKAPDMAIIGAKRKERLINVYVKAENGVTYLYFEEILQGRKNKALRGCTFYKVTRPLTVDDILKNVTRNDKTDISGAKVYNPVIKKVQAVGGYPGG